MLPKFVFIMMHAAVVIASAFRPIVAGLRMQRENILIVFRIITEVGVAPSRTPLASIWIS